jgi:hypothetical protein
MQQKFHANRRPNYFTGQLLGEEDFQAEQAYHMQTDRVHARTLHTWGIVDGLELSIREDGGPVLQPGYAIDRMGRIIAIQEAQALPLAPPAGEGSVYLFIAYEEGFEESARSADSAQNYTRIGEIAVVTDSNQPPPGDGSVVLLGRLTYASGRFAGIDTAVRKTAGARLAPDSIVTVQISNGAVTAPKLSSEIRTGWVRLPFKPSVFAEPSAARSVEFSIGVTKTYCDARGAKGTMAIPVPMAANRIKTFSIAGESNENLIKIELQRCGWDSAHNLHERTPLLEVQIPKKSPFCERWDVNKVLDPVHHAVAVYVEALGDAKISLVAAEFEWGA